LKKIIGILLAVAVILLLVNITIGFLHEKNSKPPVKKEVSTKTIDSLFVFTLKGFALDSNWVNVQFIKNTRYDSLTKVYKVNIPKDLPITVVLQSLNKTYENYKTELNSEEKVINRSSVLNIYSGDNLKLQSTFTVDEEKLRPHAKLGFILENINDLSGKNKTALLNSYYPFDILLIPDEESDSLISEISSHNKKFAVGINDKIESKKYKMEGQSKVLLKEAVRMIVRNYNNADLFLIDNNSELFKSAVFNFIKDEFAGHGVKLYNKTDFINLSGRQGEINSLLEFYITSSINKPGKVFLLEAEQFLNLQNQLSEAKKTGTKFYYPSVIIKMNSTESGG